MNTATLLENPLNRAVAAKSLALLAALLGVCWPLSSQAGQSSGQFPVAINLQDGTSNTALCRSGAGIGAFGATLTVVCVNGVLVDFSGNLSGLPWSTMQDSSYRYMLSVYREGEPIGTIDSYTGVGTATSWRMINMNHRDYLEMMVHW